MSIWSWLAHAFGVLPRTPSSSYNFWSGAGSDLGELAIVGGLVHMARAHTCHQHRCWRIGRHPVGPFTVCTRHFPAVGGSHVTDSHIAIADHENPAWGKR